MDEQLLDGLLCLHKHVPHHLKSGASTRFKVDKSAISSNIETLYFIAINRLSHLSYGLGWGMTLKESQLRPKDSSIEEVGFYFHRISEMKDKEVALNNTYFSNWLSNQLIRDLSEFLLFHLLEVYEICLTVKLSEQNLTEAGILEIKERTKRFEQNNLMDRLKIIRKEFGILITHKNELNSIYKLRNVFAHFDGVMQKKYCDGKGKFKAYWPDNKYFLVRRKTGQKVPYHRVRKPYSGNEYSQLRVEWLSKARTRTYKAEEQITLTESDLQSLLFFYMYIFNQIQKGIIKFIKQKDIPVREFNVYGGEVSLSLVGEELQ